MIVQVIAWILALLVLAAVLALSIAAIRFRKPRFALIAAIPVLIGIGGIPFGTTIDAPAHSVAVIGGILLVLIGIVAGNPITVSVLLLTERGSTSLVSKGEHGGIIVTDSTSPPGHGSEVLRGGTIIGYLERLALIAAIVLGRLEIVAVLIAVKGLGRFSELSSPEVRERFIIGTLVSLLWAGACALLIVL